MIATAIAAACGLRLASGWSYRADWADADCQHKNDQSPISIKNDCVNFDNSLTALSFAYDAQVHEGKAEPETNAHTWEVVYPEGQAKVNVAGTEYPLKQFHFHSPSENTINERYYPMEAHMVHQLPGGDTVVVAQMFEVTASDNPFLNKFWDRFPTTIGKGAEVEGGNPYTGLLSQSKTYYKWLGSFTTPPCTTNVIWIMMREPVQMSQAQLDKYRQGINAVPDNQLVVKSSTPVGVTGTWNVNLGVNNRDLQPLGGRVVEGFDPNSNAKPALQCAAEDEQIITDSDKAQSLKEDASSSAGTSSGTSSMESGSGGDSSDSESSASWWFWACLLLLFCILVPCLTFALYQLFGKKKKGKRGKPVRPQPELQYQPQTPQPQPIQGMTPPTLTVPQQQVQYMAPQQQLVQTVPQPMTTYFQGVPMAQTAQQPFYNGSVSMQPAMYQPAIQPTSPVPVAMARPYGMP